MVGHEATGAMREANCCRVTARIGTTRGLGCGDFLLAVRPATYLKFFVAVDCPSLRHRDQRVAEHGNFSFAPLPRGGGAFFLRAVLN